MTLATTAMLVGLAAPGADVPPMPEPCAHVENTFSFEVDAPVARVAPQFAPVAERAWGLPDWNPRFVHPVPEKDVEGAVFTVDHGHARSIWVNTAFDVSAGRMQYVAVTPDVLVSVIDVRVTAAGAARTHVAVRYARTALTPGKNAHVRQLGEADRQSGPAWRRGVETALGLTAR